MEVKAPEWFGRFTRRRKTPVVNMTLAALGVIVFVWLVAELLSGNVATESGVTRAVVAATILGGLVLAGFIISALHSHRLDRAYRKAYSRDMSDIENWAMNVLIPWLVKEHEIILDNQKAIRLAMERQVSTRLPREHKYGGGDAILFLKRKGEHIYLSAEIAT